ncbi:hypothetical protein T4A_12505, partial [Trichinella pseudospiralis]
LVLLGIRSSVKEDIRHAPVELVYGSPLRLPGVFFTKTLSSSAAALSDHLRILYDYIRPSPSRTKTVSLDRVKPAFLDSGEAPHVRNMQL